MNNHLPRLTLRLVLPLSALALMFAVGEPLPEPVRPDVQLALPTEALTVALQEEAEALRQEAAAAKKAAGRTAAQIRWFLTLPAASSKRCAAPTCAS